MGLQLIYGRANSGKTEYILNIASKLFNESKPFIIVVPEQYTHLAEKKLISKIGSIEQGRAEVLSFDRIAGRINSIYDNNKKRLNQMAKTLIVSEILSDTELFYYKKASKDIGFVDLCINEISQFKKYNVSYDEIYNIANKTNDYSLELKLKDISEIYKAYDDKISTEYADSDDALGILADNLENGCPYSGYTFIFDEFSSFNPNEQKVISSLSKQTETIYITVCGDFSKKSSFLFKPTIDVSKSIEAICIEAGCDIKDSIKLDSSYYESPEIEFLEKNIYSYPTESYDKKTNDVLINIYDNPYSEVSGLASQIKNIVKNNNLRYKDIGVICADIPSYAHIINDVFAKYDIPYFIDNKTGVLNHSITSSIINILDVYINNYNSVNIINYLKSGYIGIGREDLINIDNFICATNSSKNVWLYDERWKKTLEVYCHGDNKLYNSINAVRNKYILPLASLHDKIKGKNTVKFTSEKLYDFILNSGFDKRIMDYIYEFKKNNNKHLVKQYELVWKTLIEAMDTLVLVLGNKKVNLSQYRKYLYTSLRQQKIGIIPISLDSVTIGDIKRSKSDSVKYQFIIGAIDGVFPYGRKNDLIISDSEKIYLAQQGITLSPDKKGQALYERFLTYVALTATTKSLVLSYPTVDSSSNAVRPSFVLTVIKNIFPQITINSYINRNDQILNSNITDSLEFLAQQVTLVAQNKNANSIWQDIYYYHKNRFPQNIDFVKSITCNCNQITKLDKNLTNKLFGNEFYSTISRLQRYNSCRYSYYLEYLLGLKEKENFEPKSSDVGTFVHSCIEKFFKSLDNEKKSIGDINKETALDILKPIFAECIDQMYMFPDEITPKDEFNLNTVKANVINAIMSIKSHLENSAFNPIGHEITFDDNNVGPIEINLNNNKKVKLIGKIDRADSFENEDGTFIRVVDYKTGNKVFNLSDVYYGLDIQLIVYLNTLVKNTKKSHHAGALFFKIQNPIADFDNHPDADKVTETILKMNAMTGLVADDSHILNAYSPNSVISSKKATPSQFSALSDYVEAIVKISAEALSEGNIDINPYVKSSSSPCYYCSYSNICGFNDGVNGECRNLETLTEKSLWNIIMKQSKEGDKQ